MNFFARKVALLRCLAVGFAALLLIAASAAAQGGVLTPHGVARIRNVSAAAIAPTASPLLTF